jgi:hypothetical protein
VNATSYTVTRNVSRRPSYALLSSAPSIHKGVDMAQSFLLAFMQGGQEVSLNKSIDICRSVLEAQPQKLPRFKLFRILGFSLGLPLHKTRSLGEPR